MRLYDDVHRQKQKEKSNGKFTFGILVMMIGLIVVTTIFTGESANSNDLEKYYQITVQSGDTLWEIAKKYVSPEEDVRNLILQIRRINDLKSAEILPGLMILIPAS